MGDLGLLCVRYRQYSVDLVLNNSYQLLHWQQWPLSIQ